MLRKVGLVGVVRKGKRRMYSLNGQELRPVFDWVKEYERFWEHQLQRIKVRAEEMQRDKLRREKTQREQAEGKSKPDESPPQS